MPVSQVRRSYNHQVRMWLDIAGNTDLTMLYGLKLEDIRSGKFPDGTNFARLAKGITSVTPAAADTATTESDYSDNGQSHTDVSGKAISYTNTGTRYIGDPVQDFVADKFSRTGDELKTLAIVVDPDSTLRCMVVTIQNVVGWGGNANAVSTFSFNMAVDGMQFVTHIDGQTECEITNITLGPTKPNITVGGTLQLTASIEPEYAVNNEVLWASSDATVATVDATGMLTALKVGKTVVSAWPKSDDSMVGTLLIDVATKKNGQSTVEVQSPDSADGTDNSDNSDNSDDDSDNKKNFLGPKFKRNLK